jgi:hypothetical protein
VSAIAPAFVPSSFRWGSSSAPWYETALIVFSILVMAVFCVLMFRRLRRHDWRLQRVRDQWQPLAVMGELCPRGWQAHITLYGRGAPVPPDAPESRVPPVELEWKLFDGEPSQVVSVRRVWTRSIAGALQTMVDDRRTDLTLDQVQLTVAEEGELPWAE